MTNTELTIKRLESLKPMLVKMKDDPQFERAVCNSHPNVSPIPNGRLSCNGPCTDCVFGTDVLHDKDGNIIKYGHLEEVINELKLMTLLEE